MWRKSKYIINETGRECSKCWVFKEWDLFNNDKKQKNWKTVACKDCRNKARDSWRESYIWQIKTKNYRILKRADPNYREKENLRYKERRQKTDRSDYDREYKRKNRDHILELRRQREENYFRKWKKVKFWEMVWKILDYKFKVWCLVLFENWFKMWLAKYRLKPIKRNIKAIY